MTQKLLIASALAAAAVLAAPTAAHALPTCSLAGYYPAPLEYWHAAPNHNSWRCDQASGKCSLSGWILSPQTIPTGGAPAIIFAHGSQGQNATDEQSLDEYSCAIKNFLDAGYVVYMPFRRGVSDVTSEGMLPGVMRNNGWTHWSNTGTSAEDFATAFDNGSGDQHVLEYITYLQAEADDLPAVINALDAYIRPGSGLPMVDPTRVAVVGHSMGGAFVTFASTDDNLYDARFVNHQGPRAFVSLSGAAMSWYGSHWWHDIIQSSAAIHNAPIMFTRVLNESDPAIGPVDFQSAWVPYNAAANVGGGARINTYGSIVPDTCAATLPAYWCVHGTFVTDQRYIDEWFPDVHQFLNHKGM